MSDLWQQVAAGLVESAHVPCAEALEVQDHKAIKGLLAGFATIPAVLLLGGSLNMESLKGREECLVKFHRDLCAGLDVSNDVGGFFGYEDNLAQPVAIAVNIVRDQIALLEQLHILEAKKAKAATEPSLFS